MRIRITIEVIEALDEPEKLTEEEIRLALGTFDKGVDWKLFIHDPIYHHIVSRQRNALRAGYKDWFMCGRIP